MSKQIGKSVNKLVATQKVKTILKSATVTSMKDKTQGSEQIKQMINSIQPNDLNEKESSIEPNKTPKRTQKLPSTPPKQHSSPTPQSQTAMPNPEFMASRHEIEELKQMQLNIQSQLNNMQETFLEKFGRLEDKEMSKNRSNTPDN